MIESQGIRLFVFFLLFKPVFVLNHGNDAKCCIHIGMANTAEFRTLNKKRSKFVRQKPCIIVPAFNRIDFDTKGGDIEAVQDIRRCDIQFDGLGQRDDQIIFCFFVIGIHEKPGELCAMTSISMASSGTFLKPV